MKAIAALIAALKSILENEVNSQDIQKLHEALEMLKRGASADMKVFPVTSYDTLKAHIDGLAERAVSPAESVTARQAPDLSHLQRYVATPHDDRGMREEKLGAWVLLRDVQALLSSTAQPLQPADPQPTYAEWRKVVSLVHDAIKVVRTGPAITILMQCVDSLDAWSDQVAQPLQQEGGKELSPARTPCDCNKPGGCITQLKLTENQYCKASIWAPGVGPALSQPSDNLQQASPTKTGCEKCGNGIGHDLGCDNHSANHPEPALSQYKEYRLFMDAHRKLAIKQAGADAISEEMVRWHGDRHWGGKPGEMWRACAALYRAAPPQQGMTAIAEMKRSVAGGALYLQTLIPPHMIPEGTKLYRVDGDTGELPG
jgi:hypothetical protein